MTMALVVVTDGRDCVHETIASASTMLDGPFVERYLYDDSGDEFHTAALRSRYGRQGWRVFNHPGGRQGFGGAVRFVRSTVAEVTEADHVFWLEDDFTFNERIPLHRMATVLHTNAELAQVCLLRQAWNDEEKAAGGIVQCHPGDYVERCDVFGNRWLEHGRCFSTNPHVVSVRLLRRPWPDVVHSEGVFTHELLADGYRFAYWGGRYDPPAVEHIGHQRVGVGY